MAVSYRPAPEVEKIAGELIKKYHPQLHHLPDRIEYVFRSKASSKNGKPVGGKARVVRGLPQYLAQRAEEFYLIEIATDVWGELDPDQRAALVDHELNHCGGRDPDSDKLLITPHDLEEFAVVVKRHGLWHNGVRHFVRVAGEQLTLKLPEAVGQ